jgi:hypothetical protein
MKQAIISFIAGMDQEDAEEIVWLVSFGVLSGMMMGAVCFG